MHIHDRRNGLVRRRCLLAPTSPTQPGKLLELSGRGTTCETSEVLIQNYLTWILGPARQSLTHVMPLRTSTATNAPTLEETYYTGSSIQLYLGKPPVLPDHDHDVHPTTEIADRVALPSTPPDLSITLEKRLYSSMSRIPHVWTAHVQHTSPLPGGPPSPYPPLLVAKIFDATFVDEEISDYTDPFALRDKSVSCEVEAYRIIESLQGTVVPRFYGHFIAPLPSQQNRIVNVILMEYVQGTDLRILVPYEIAETVCSVHKEAIIVHALTVFFDVLALGVVQRDMQPRNIILRPQQQHEPGTQVEYCKTSSCPLHLEVDCKDLRMVMVDFEVVEFKEPDPSFSERSKQIEYINTYLKEKYLSRWLESAIV